MPKKKKNQQRRPSLLSPDLLKAARRRLLARKALRSGELEDIRTANREQWDPGYRILRYRRVIPADKYPLPISRTSYVLPRTFEAHLQFISKECKPMALPELIHKLEEYEEIPDKTVVVTFDGGHRDTFIHALPLLLRHRVPATVFFPSAYIGTNAYLFEDRVALGLIMMATQKKLRMPEFPFIAADVYEEIKNLSPEMEINPATIAVFIVGLRRLKEKEIAAVFTFFAQTFSDVRMDPIVEDFMRWEDIRYMQKMGISFGTMGYAHHLATSLSAELFHRDLQEGIAKAREQNVRLETPFCFPDGIYTPEAIEVLFKFGVRWVMGVGILPEPRYQVQLPMILGRIPMYQSVAYCKEIFVCRLWNISLSGVEY